MDEDTKERKTICRAISLRKCASGKDDLHDSTDCLIKVTEMKAEQCMNRYVDWSGTAGDVFLLILLLLFFLLFSSSSFSYSSSSFSSFFLFFDIESKINKLGWEKISLAYVG
jgi:hypothetical protein